NVVAEDPRLRILVQHRCGDSRLDEGRSRPYDARLALPSTGRNLMNVVEEPLAESAPVARELAARLCRVDPGSGESCAWYHGLWQFLRLMKLVTTPEHHADFYREALGKAAREGESRNVLIA